MIEMQIYDKMKSYLFDKKKKYLYIIIHKVKNIYILFKEIEIDKIGVIIFSINIIFRLTNVQIQNIINLYTDKLIKSQKLISINNYSHIYNLLVKLNN